MSLLSLIIAIVVVGVVLYCINQFAPMDGKIKRILNWVVVGVLVIWMLNGFGVLDFLDTVHVGKVHR